MSLFVVQIVAARILNSTCKDQKLAPVATGAVERNLRRLGEQPPKLFMQLIEFLIEVDNSFAAPPRMYNR